MSQNPQATVNEALKNSLASESRWERAHKAAQSFFEKLVLLTRGEKSIADFDPSLISLIINFVSGIKRDNLAGQISLQEVFDNQAVVLEVRSDETILLEVVYNENTEVTHAAV